MVGSALAARIRRAIKVGIRGVLTIFGAVEIDCVYTWVGFRRRRGFARLRVLRAISCLPSWSVGCTSQTIRQPCLRLKLLPL